MSANLKRCGQNKTKMTHPYSQRLSDVTGDREKSNDVFVHGDVEGQQHIIYFGGDVQNYPEKMDGNNAKYIQWNLENTAYVIYNKFPQSLVFVVKPKTMSLNTFSMYSNFMIINESGGPIHDCSSGAAKHLSLLYKSACCIVADSLVTNHKFSAENVPVKIIGFSKGCTVLNQLVYEIPYVIQHDRETKQFISKVKNIYWLDAGHNGGDLSMPNQHAYVTEPHLVKTLAEQGYQITIYVSPYQVYDLLRPWLGQHYRQFCKLLSKFKANFSAQVSFEQEPGSIENHFKILEIFQP